MTLEKALILTEEVGSFLVIDCIRFTLESKEGQFPHIHFTKGNPKYPELDGCLYLLKKGYFKHGKHIGELPKNIYKEFLNWIRIDKNFLFLCKEWNDANNANFISKEQIYDSYGNVKNPYKQ